VSEVQGYTRSSISDCSSTFDQLLTVSSVGRHQLRAAVPVPSRVCKVVESRGPFNERATTKKIKSTPSMLR
jgi:hypothetical protein